MDEQSINGLTTGGNELGEAIPFPEYVQPMKKEINFSGAERIMAFVTAVLAFFFVHLVLWNISGFFTTLFYIAVITAVVVFLRKNGCVFSGFHKAFAAVLYLFSFVFSITANGFIKGLDVIFLFAGGAYFVYSVCSATEIFGRFMPFEMLKCLLEYPFSHFSKEYSAINSTVKKSKFGSNAKLIAAGLIVAVPLTVVVAALLMSADSGMQRILSSVARLIHTQNIWTLIIEFALSIPAGGYLFGMLYSNLHKDEVSALDEGKCETICENARKINNTIIYSAVTPICILYVLFFISQANYFLSAFMGRLPESYSYAQYARKGFFELFAIELINAAVILFISFLSKNSGRNKPRMLKFYICAISVFTLLITATAISKMVMYIDTYGLTPLRVYTTWFMALTAIMFVFVIIRQFRPSFRFMTAASVSFAVMFGILCFSRPDAVIAKYNLEYCSDSITYNDIEEMMSMSDDAVSVILDSKYRDIVENCIEQHNEAFYQKLQFGAEGTYKEMTYEKFRNKCTAEIEKNRYAGYNLSAVIIRLNKSK